MIGRTIPFQMQSAGSNSNAGTAVAKASNGLGLAGGDQSFGNELMQVGRQPSDVPGSEVPLSSRQTVQRFANRITYEEAQASVQKDRSETQQLADGTGQNGDPLSALAHMMDGLSVSEAPDDLGLQASLSQGIALSEFVTQSGSAEAEAVDEVAKSVVVDGMSLPVGPITAQLSGAKNSPELLQTLASEAGVVGLSVPKSTNQIVAGQMVPTTAANTPAATPGDLDVLGRAQLQSAEVSRRPIANANLENAASRAMQATLANALGSLSRLEGADVRAAGQFASSQFAGDGGGTISGLEGRVTIEREIIDRVTIERPIGERGIMRAERQLEGIATRFEPLNSRAVTTPADTIESGQILSRGETVAETANRGDIKGSPVAMAASANASNVATVASPVDAPIAQMGLDTLAPSVRPAAQVTEGLASELRAQAVAATLSAGRGGGEIAPVKTLTLQLNPAGLGTVQARLQWVGDGLKIALGADNPQTMEMLKADAEMLRSSIRALGIADAEISFSQSSNHRADGAGLSGSGSMSDSQQRMHENAAGGSDDNRGQRSLNEGDEHADLSRREDNFASDSNAHDRGHVVI